MKKPNLYALTSRLNLVLHRRVKMKKAVIPLLVLYRITLLFCLSTFMNPANAADATVVKNQAQIVHGYIAAFNARDINAMLEMVTDDLQWLSIDGDKITVEAKSKEVLRTTMVEYFESCVSCRSRLAHTFSTSSRVSGLEVASFETSTGVQEQGSVSLYEFSNGLIKRVYYFPAEK